MNESVVNTTNFYPGGRRSTTPSWSSASPRPSIFTGRRSFSSDCSPITLSVTTDDRYMLVTIFSPHLRNPRHIFWAAISLMELLILLNTALELITVQSRDYSVCRLWIIFHLADDSALMLCHLLATVDRYLSIARYEWYKVDQLPSVTDPENAGCFSRKPKGSRMGRIKNSSLPQFVHQHCNVLVVYSTDELLRFGDLLVRLGER
ncbi:LOW QUALITY PROTEIN: hypothetical protein DAPPUDRAFT_240696 [Daphnia pulex]|uniref:G-protein coupled receptors family 1 profile domain-containing protein n=1 Tax=Daphnia pulex TaxID=6669 RepID=E9GCA0_DAPPU|nr:LOW QUALITY PROTEIN: hypothetical protein DAPPUDRAFT_240696 [Daphnia pulex]|eukprot:EFX82894.1 LOW QUALITY PROTEIN: hypothetical protein DAPPUDRAFT_240696 [Daphnia pulex]